MERLKYRIPDEPNYATYLDQIPCKLSVPHAMASLGELWMQGIGADEFPPVICGEVVNHWFRLGAGYVDGHPRERTAIGFSLGAVMGADRRQGHVVARYFWQTPMLTNAFDDRPWREAQDGFNAGLLAGYVQGRELNFQQRKILWAFLVGQVTCKPDLATSRQWHDSEWKQWYETVAAVFRQHIAE